MKAGAGESHERSGTAARAAVGGLLFAVGVWFLWRDIPAWNAIWYVPAWYGYLLLLDALTERLGGRSLVRQPATVLAPMMFWSVPFWFLFEAYNLVLENWYYVFVLHDDRIQFAVSWIAFATVLPACFFHAELIRSSGIFETARWRPVRVGRLTETGLALIGVSSIVLPLIWPRQAFFLVWGATFFVPELINRRIGAPSLLRDLERGEPARPLRLLSGGMLAGLAWESLNYWARCKWIYTVPGLEQLKLFEMPLIGFLGFPALAVAGFSFYSLLSHLIRGGRHWEAPERPTRPTSKLLYSAAALTAVVLTMFVFEAMVVRTVASRRPLLSELEGLTARDVVRIAEAGLDSPERLHRAVVTYGLERLFARTGVESARLGPAARHAALSLHKGMGTQRAGELIAAGFDSVGDLVNRDADDVHARMTETARAGGRAPPRLSEVRVWIRAAAPSGRPRR